MRVCITYERMLDDYAIINVAQKPTDIDPKQYMNLLPLSIKFEDSPQYNLKPAYFQNNSTSRNPELSAAILNVLSRHSASSTLPRWLETEGALFPDIKLVAALINHDGLRLSFADIGSRRTHEYWLRVGRTTDVKLTFCTADGKKYCYEESCLQRSKDAGCDWSFLFRRLISDRVIKVTELGDAGPSGPRREIYFSPTETGDPTVSEFLIRDFR